MKTALLFCLIFPVSFVPVSLSYAGEADAFFVKGNESYQNGDYKAAINEYQKIIEMGYESWEVYYNLGNAYFKDRQLGRAILNFERAKQVNPKNEDLIYNLDLVNLSIADRIQELPSFFLSSWITNFANLFDLGMLGIVTLVIYVIFIFLIVTRIFLKPVRLRKPIFLTTMIIGFLLLFFSGIFSLRIIDSETKSEAVLLTTKVDIKSAPDAGGTDVFTLHEGIKVQIKDRSLDWVKIQLADGKVGWLKSEMIEEI